jgi:antitoxin FitA
MATLTVRNLDDVVVRQLRIRAAEHGRSAEAEPASRRRNAWRNSDGALPGAARSQVRSCWPQRGPRGCSR